MSKPKKRFYSNYGIVEKGSSSLKIGFELRRNNRMKFTACVGNECIWIKRRITRKNNTRNKYV